jgi:hypothetical protein
MQIDFTAWRRSVSVLLLIFATITSLAAQPRPKKKPGLDRETATKLVRGHGLTIQGSFGVLNSGDQDRFYQQLMAGEVIVCQKGSGLSDPECLPGRRGSGVSRGSGEIVFVAGSLMPVEVTGVTKTSETSAVADVRLSFDPTAMYAQFREALDQLDGHSGSSSKEFLMQKKQRSAAQATFQLYDDGWRFQSIQ